MSAPAPIADRSSFLRVSEALAGFVTSARGDQLYARCPVPEHEDRNASLSATWRVDGKTGGGRTFITCHGGCDVRDVVAALGFSRSLADLYDTPPARPDDAGRQRWSPPGPTRKPRKPAPADTPSSAGKGERRRKLVTTWPYCDEHGAVVFEVSRWEPKEFTVRSFDASGRRQARWPAKDRRVLYRLPEVLAAVQAAAEVWVCEGEKDADALAMAGVAATTNPGGAAVGRDASLKWLPQYTETLRGAHVVLVADRDPAKRRNGRGYEGYRHVLHLADQLADVAASLRVVQAATGKDAADHLAAGRELGEFEPLDLGELRGLVDELDTAAAEPARTPADKPAPATRPGETVDLETARRRRRRPGPEKPGGPGGGGGDGGPPAELPVVVVRDQFRATPDGLFKETIDTDRQRVVLKQLLDVRVRLAARVQVDLADGEPLELSHVDLVATRNSQSVLLPEVSRRRWESCTWVGDLPWTTVSDDTARGRSLLRNAVSQTSGEVPMTTAYGALGWQEIDGRWRYVHADGVLDETGPVDGVRVCPPRPLEPFKLPAPPADAAELRAAVLASVALMDAVPARIAAPVLGAAYRAVLGWSRVTLMPVGQRAGGKTGLTAYAAQHYAPTVRHNRMPSTGAGEEASTAGSLGELRYRAGDLLLPLDDIAPDRGVERASIRCAQIARSQYNREGRNRLTRDAELRVSHPPRSLPMVTGEETTTVDSAESRLLAIRIRPGDVDARGTLAPLDKAGAPRRRAQLTAAMVTYFAPRMPLADWLDERAAELCAELVDDQAADANADGRHAESIADVAVGWQAMLEMARARGALTEDEAADLWRRAWAGLAEAKRQLSAGLAHRTPAARFRELLTTALVRRDVALLDRRGGQPPEADRCGWDRTESTHPEYPDVWRRAGTVIGWTDGATVWLNPGAAFAAVDRQAAAQHEDLRLTKDGLAEALANAGVTRTRTVKGYVRYSRVVRVGSSMRPEDVWELDWAWLYPPDDEADELDPQPHPEPPPAALPPADEQTDTGQDDEPATTETPPTVAESEPPAPTSSSAGECPAEPREACVGTESGRNGPIHYAGPAVVCAAAVGWLARVGADPALVELPAEAAAGDLAALLGWADGLDLGHRDGRGRYRGARHGYGQIWLYPELRRRIGLPASLPPRDPDKAPPAAHRRVRETIEAAGWELASPNVGAWTVIYRRGGRRYHLVVPEWLDEHPLGELDELPQTLARRLGRVAELVGVAYRYSPGVTGVGLVGVTRPGLFTDDQPADQRFHVKTPSGEVTVPKPSKQPNLELDYAWQRAPEPDEDRCRWAYCWDVSGMYLAAAGSLPLGYGAPERVERPEWDPKRPGYWLITAPEWEHARLPDPIVGQDRRQKKAQLRVTTPTLKALIDEYGLDVEILSGQLWPAEGDGSGGTARIMDKWAAELRTARLAAMRLDPDTDPDAKTLLALVKGLYRHGVGRLDAGSMRDTDHPLWRPDWRQHIIAQARYALTRKIATAARSDRYPLAVAVDSVVYASDADDWDAALPPGYQAGSNLGQVRPVGRVPLDQVTGMLRAGSTPAPTRVDDTGATHPGLIDTFKAGDQP